MNLVEPRGRRWLWTVSIWWRRTQNRWWDMRAVAAGYCNRRTPPWQGYVHWRCALRRNHPLPHRYRNYVWIGMVEFRPVLEWPDQPWPRHMEPTRRQARQRWGGNR